MAKTSMSEIGNKFILEVIKHIKWRAYRECL